MRLYYDYIGLLAIALCGLILAAMLGPFPYYHPNWWKMHRWASADCARHGIPEDKCTLIRLNMTGPVYTQIRNGEKIESGWTLGPVETLIYDICLEHGELKRIR